jgi:hypothetical protein
MSGLAERVPMRMSEASDSAGGPAPDLHSVPAATATRRRGRPPLFTPDQVLAEIREASAGGTLFRVHLERPALYARARRLWGSWSSALAKAGLQPQEILEAARLRAIDTRRQKRKSGTL